jgi:hypothetical protein
MGGTNEQRRISPVVAATKTPMQYDTGRVCEKAVETNFENNHMRWME